MWNTKSKFSFNLLKDVAFLELTMQPGHPETRGNPPASDFHLQVFFFVAVVVVLKKGSSC